MHREPPSRPTPLPDVHDPTGNPYGPHPNGTDLAAGGADSSPYDTEPTGERTEVAAHDRSMNRTGKNDPSGKNE